MAYFLGVTPSNIKKLHLEGKGPAPTTSVSGRRTYSAEQMFELRQYLDRHGRSDFKKYVPHRRGSEPLQVISVVNFKGGSGKTTTACHLAQHLALTGHRVLAIDLDPQASATSWKDLRKGDTPVVVPAQVSRLAQVLETAAKHGADIAIIDTAPHSESAALAAARASTLPSKKRWHV